MRRLNRRRVFDSTRGKFVNKKPNQGMQSKELQMTEAAVEECLARQEARLRRGYQTFHKPILAPGEIEVVIDLTQAEATPPQPATEIDIRPKIGDTGRTLGEISLRNSN